MSGKRAVIGGVLIGVLVFAVVIGAIYFGTNDEARETLFSRWDVESASENGNLVASGFIEAERLELATDMGGRVVTLPFTEGDEVAAGDILVGLNAGLLEASRAAAQAQLDITVAQRDQLLAGVPETTLRQAEAQVAIAQAAVDAARVALDDMIALRNNPQDILVQVVEAEAQVNAARSQVDVALAQFNMADRTLEIREDFEETLDEMREQYGDAVPLPEMPLDLELAPYRYDAATTNLTMAQEALRETQDLLTVLRGLAYDPQAIQAQVISAQTMLDTAEAQLALAQAQLDQMRAGATADQLTMVDAQVARAEAVLNAVETRIARMTLTAPMGGIILEQSIYVGELALPGVPLVTLANLDVVDLTVYISPAQFDRVSLNQTVLIAVDSFPNRIFEGVVVYISDEAEFTPRSIQTREDRVNLVYAVKIRLDNPDHLLKPGMPADADFGPLEEVTGES